MIKKKFLLLSIAATLTCCVISCKKQGISETEKSPEIDVVQDSKALHGGPQETTDPKIIAAIRKEMQVSNNLNAPEKNSASAAANIIETYKGFKIEKTSATPTDILNIVKGEIDQLISKLPSSLLDKYKTLTAVYIVPPSSSAKGVYYDATLKKIVLNDYDNYRYYKKVATSNVLGHECGHYFNHIYLSGSWENSTNKTNYNNAVKNKIYAADEYVLSNYSEYFAVNVECFYISASREPFDNARFKTKDPNEYNFIQANVK